MPWSQINRDVHEKFYGLEGAPPDYATDLRLAHGLLEDLYRRGFYLTGGFVWNPIDHTRRFKLAMVLVAPQPKDGRVQVQLSSPDDVAFETLQETFEVAVCLAAIHAATIFPKREAA